jgi:hypothetical protein
MMKPYTLSPAKVQTQGEETLTSERQQGYDLCLQCLPDFGDGIKCGFFRLRRGASTVFLNTTLKRAFLIFICLVFLLCLHQSQLDLQILAAADINEMQKTIQHEVAVTVKLVQVYPTDKKGNPILDLQKEDFVVFDNGQRQVLTEFERHVISQPPSSEESKPATTEEAPAQTDRELIRRKFLLLFDFAFNNAIGLEKAKRAALHFIDTQLRPTDEVGVLS